MTTSEMVYPDAGVAVAATTLLPAELIDSFATLIATSGDPYARACVAVRLLEEVYSTVEWLDDLVVSPTELLSLRQVLVEIRAHRDRMAAAADPHRAVA